MRTESPTSKLTEEQRRDVCALLAQFKKPTEIVQVLKDRYGVVVDRHAVYTYTTDRWKPLVDKYRQQYALELTTVPLYHKRVRLERLDHQYQEIEQESVSTARARAIRRAELRAVLKEAREEVRPWEEAADKNQTNILSIQFNGMDDGALFKRREELLKVIKTVPARKEKEGSNGQQALVESEIVP